MKKLLSVLLSIVMIITTFTCLSTVAFADSTVVFSEDFENLNVDDTVDAGDALEWKEYDEGEEGYRKGTPNANGWMSDKACTVTDAVASTEGGKSLSLPSWGAIYKVVDVAANTNYTFTIKYNATSVVWRDINIQDASAVGEDGYAFKNYTKFEPVKAYNRVQAFDNTLLPIMVEKRDRDFTANTWETYTAKFSTTDTNIKKIIITIACEAAMYIDDISLTGEVDTDATKIFRNGSFEYSTPADVAKVVKNNDNGNVRSTEWKVPTPTINKDGWVGSHYANGHVVKGETTYNTTSSSFTTPKAQDGSQMIRLTTGWHTLAKVITVEANQDYKLTYYYYADAKDAGFNDGNDYVLGLNASATTVTIPATYEADGVTIKDCLGDIKTDGTDGQTKLGVEFKKGDDKNVVGAWTQRTIYFNSGSFTKVLIPFYFKSGNVYIDNVSVDTYIPVRINKEVIGADDKNAGSAKVELVEDEDLGTQAVYTAKNTANSEFLGWYDGEELVTNELVYKVAYVENEFKQLTAKFNCTYKNEFEDGYFEDLSVGASILEGQKIATESQQIEDTTNYKYKFTSTPNLDGWFASQTVHTADVAVKANGVDENNQALQIKQWSKIGRIVEVTPNSLYNLSFKYLIPTGGEFGSFNVYDITGYEGGFSGRNDFADVNVNSKERLFIAEDATSFGAIEGAYLRRVDKANADPENPTTHDVWVNVNKALNIGKETTKLLVVWSPEGKQPFYLDDVELQLDHVHNFTNDCQEYCDDEDCKLSREPLAPHTYNENDPCDEDCDVCGELREVEHNPVLVVTKKASFDDNGTGYVKCDKCNDTLQGVIISKLETVELSTTSYTYNGKKKAPIVTVKDDRGIVVSDEHYDVEFLTSAKYVGEHKVKVTFKGEMYEGEKELTFTIKPGKTTIKKLTAYTKSIKVYINKKTTQTSGYQLEWSRSKTFSSSKKALIKKNSTTTYTIKSLSRKKTYYVRVRCFKTTSTGKRIYGDWASYKYTKTK